MDKQHQAVRRVGTQMQHPDTTSSNASGGNTSANATTSFGLAAVLLCEDRPATQIPVVSVTDSHNRRKATQTSAHQNQDSPMLQTPLRRSVVDGQVTAGSRHSTLPDSDSRTTAFCPDTWLWRTCLIRRVLLPTPPLTSANRKTFSPRYLP